MSAGSTLDYRGLGPFLPFGVLERIVRDMGTLTLVVDPGVEPLVALWAQRRGYYAVQKGNMVVVSIAPVEVEAAAGGSGGGGRGAAARQAAARAAAAAVELRVDEKGWRSDISEKLSDVTFVITTVLKAPITYRGPARGPGFHSAISSKSGVLLRASIGGQDYFLYIVEGRVLAGAQIGRPLTPKQAESIVEQLKSSSDAVVTVYDASGMF